jgi:hypothetical protein
MLRPHPPSFGNGDQLLHAPVTNSSMTSSMLRRPPPPPCSGDHFLHKATVPDEQTLIPTTRPTFSIHI